MIFGILVLLLTVITAFIVYLPEIAFSVHANHPRQSDSVLYSNMFVGAFILPFISGYSGLYFITVAAAAIHFFVSNKLRINLTAIGSVASLLLLSRNVSEELTKNNTSIMTFVMLGVFVALYGSSLACFIINHNEG